MNKSRSSLSRQQKHVTAMQARVNPFRRPYVASTLEVSVACQGRSTRGSRCALTSSALLLRHVTTPSSITHKPARIRVRPTSYSLTCRNVRRLTRSAAILRVKYSVQCIMGKSWLSVRSITGSIERNRKPKTSI